MTVKKLSKKSPLRKENKEDADRVNQFIGGGGKTTEESKSSIKEDERLSRFTIRMPPQFVKLIDQKRASSIGNISRNTWILEAIAQRLKSDD